MHRDHWFSGARFIVQIPHKRKGMVPVAYCESEGEAEALVINYRQNLGRRATAGSKIIPIDKDWRPRHGQLE